MSAFDYAAAPSIRTLAQALADGRASSAEATDFALARLQAANERGNAVIAFEADDARQAAVAADARRKQSGTPAPATGGRPSLDGIPLAHKDMFDRAGKIASWGGRIQRAEPAAQTATVLARLEAAGAIYLAALHLTEFAFGPTGHNYVLGHGRNPHDPGRISGGSSSGSAISVSMGAIPAALGSDTAGSLRLPAAACGVLSLKPTWTRVTRAGAMPLSGLLDCVGPIARTVEDLAIILSHLAGHDPRDGLSAKRAVPDYVAAAKPASVAGRTIALDEALIARADPSVQTRLDATRRVFEAAGCRIVSTRVTNWDQIDHLTQLLQLPEVASAHGRLLRHRAADYGPQVRARIEFGHFISGADHQTAVRARGQILARFLAEAMPDADAFLLPTFADRVPTIAELDLAGGPTLMAGLARVILFTRAINYLGLPALTMPYADRDDGVPNGFQLVGRPFAEADLLSLGAIYESTVPCEPRLA